MTFRPTGILVALVTPFTDRGDVATADLERLAHTVIDQGAAGIVALGTTGESATLGPQERRDVVRICAAVCRERGVPIVVGVGSNDTAGTVRDVANLHVDADVDAALVVVPYYSRPSEAGVVAHFEHVADRSPLPLILYNVPYRTGQGIGCESLLRLAEHPRIVGVKQAVGAVDTDTARLDRRGPRPRQPARRPRLRPDVGTEPDADQGGTRRAGSHRDGERPAAFADRGAVTTPEAPPER